MTHDTIPAWPSIPEMPPTPVPESGNLTVDDDALLLILLYPDEGHHGLYAKLIGYLESNKRQPWNPEYQIQAKKGMRELFEVALAQMSYPGEGIEDARAELWRLRRSPDGMEILDSLYRCGRQLRYQNTYHPEQLYDRGDFLTFGVASAYDHTDEVRPAICRVYVTPKMQSAGYVAASTIRRARDMGYEPFGKVWDESTNHSPNPRTDRLLFYVQTEEQLNILMYALKEINTREPELFEEIPPLLTEKTDIPGVGLADEPLDSNGHISFHSSREALIDEALGITLSRVVGSGNEWMLGNNGQAIDKRIIECRNAIEEGTLTRQEVLNALRDAIREAAPRHRVSPENFARNLY